MLLFLSKADVVAIAEWELILNRAGIPFGGNEVIKLTEWPVCPRHRAKYTTMYYNVTKQMLIIGEPALFKNTIESQKIHTCIYFFSTRPVVVILTTTMWNPQD